MKPPIIKTNQRKFLRTMYVWIIIALLVPLTSFAMLAYHKSGQAILNNEYQANKKILFQVKFSIDNMDDMILNSVFSLYSNSDVRSIMYNKEIDFTELVREINNLRTSTVSSNPFIRSIYIYNRELDTYYSTMGELLFKDENFDKLLHDGREIPVLKPIPRKMEYSGGGNTMASENVVSYFMYEFKDENNVPAGAVVVNANTNWLMQNIQKLNAVDEKSLDEVIILDSEGGILGHDQEKDTIPVRMREAYLANQAGKPEDQRDTTDYFLTDLNGEKYLITYTFVDKMNWTLVKAQRYDEVFQKLETLKSTFLIITIAFLAAAVLIGFVLSRHIYRPIGQLVRNVSTANRESGRDESRDEFTYLNDMFRLSQEQINRFNEKKNSEQEIMKSFFLRKLLVDSHSIGESELEQAVQGYELKLSLHKPLIVCLARIDDFRQFKDQRSPFEQSLCIFGLMNITAEWLRQSYVTEDVDMKNDYVVFIVNVEPGTPEADGDLDGMIGLLEQAQRYIQDYYHLSVSMTISDTVNNSRELSDKFYEARNSMVYRTLLGKSSIATNRQIREREAHPQLSFAPALAKKLTEAIKSGHGAEAEESLAKIFAEIGTLNYNNALYSAMSLINTLKATVEEINRAKIEPVRIDFNLLTRQLFESETLSEFHATLSAQLSDMLSKSENAESEKQSILVDAIRELIEVDYANPALCLQYVADKINSPSKSVSRLFNGSMNMSVGDYINDIRLKKAIEWMESSTLSTKEILQKVGMDNESYFYRLFKKKYGTTPKEYVTSRSLQRLQSKE